MVGVSILIAAHNAETTIREAVESALGQTYRDVEVVVVADGPTDGTAEVLRSLSGITVIEQPNSGVAAARNRAFEASTGDLVTFLDHDDRLRPNGVQTQVSVLQEADSEFVFGRSGLMDGAGRVLRTDDPPPPYRGDLYEKLLRRSWVLPGAMLARRHALERVGAWNAAFVPAEDLDFMLRLARQCRGVDHAEIVFDYRIGGSQLSRSYARMLRACLDVLDSQTEYVRGNPRLTKARAEGVRYYRGYFGTKLAISDLARALQERSDVSGATVRAIRACLRNPGVALALLRGQLTRRPADVAGST